MVDITSIKPIERTVEINHPGTHAPIGLRVFLISMNDDRMKALKRNITKKRMELEKRGKVFSVDDIEENTRNLVYGVTTGWEWYNPTGNLGDTDYDEAAMLDFHGEQPEFNIRNFNRVYDEIDWFGTQIQTEVQQDEEFFSHSK